MADDNHVDVKSTTITLNIKAISSVITGLVAIMGSVWAIDNHYASAADVERMQRGFEGQIRSLRQERAEDELLKLSVKKQLQNGKLDPVDQALYERYQQRVAATQKEEKEAVAQDAAAKAKK